MSVVGISAATGRQLGGIEHLRQSVRDILTTPIGSRVMRRDYGSHVPELLDQNLTALTLAQLYASTVDALHRWEPRLRVTRVQAEGDAATLEAGRIAISLDAEYLPEGREIRLEGIVI